MSDITANVVVSMPSQLFTMARSFKAVANGKVYIGQIDTDPTNPSNQIQVYMENEDGSLIPVSQPIIINAGGYPVYNGQIAKFVTVENNSMAVYDSYGTQQFYFPNILKYSPDQLRQELESEGGAVTVDVLGGPSGYGLIGEVDSFDDLRSIAPSEDGVKIKLRGYRSGSYLGGGIFIGKLSAGEDNGITIASNGGSYHWVKEEIYNIDAFQCGAYGDDSNDDSSYIQKGIDYISSLSLVAGNVKGELSLPFGYTYLIANQLIFNTPVKFSCYGNIHSTVTGATIRVGTSLDWNVGYEFYFRNVYSNKSLSFPTTIVDGGNSFALITSMNFSKFMVDHATGFNDRVFDLRADGSFGYQQVVQHNTFTLGQIVNSGIGIKLLSLDAATSSAQGNRFYIQNIYQNYNNLQIDDANHSASNSNTFYINAMDNCRDVGIDLYGHMNTFYVGFSGAPGTALRENNSYGNRATFGNSVPTDLVVNFGISADNSLQAANPGPSYLPASQGVTSGTAYQNTYGTPVQVMGSVSFTSAGSVQVIYGKNPGDMEVVQTITGLSGNSMPIYITVPWGWYYKLFTVSGAVVYSTLKLYASS